MALLLTPIESPSTPDLWLCGCNWSIKTSWSLAESNGISDHLPISIVINHRIRYQNIIPRKARWHRNGVDWFSFTNEVESRMQQLPEEPNISIRISRFNNILKSSASLHISKIKLSKKPKALDQSTRLIKDSQLQPLPLYYPPKLAGMDCRLSRSKHSYQRSQEYQLEGSLTQFYVKRWRSRCMEGHSRPQQHARY